MSQDATKESIEAFAKANDLVIESTFIPWSCSRSFKEKARPSERNLNWRVTLKHKGREILTTDYSAGIAHCPSYKKFGRTLTVHEADIIEAETEVGFAVSYLTSTGPSANQKRPILPETASVLHNLALDADVLDSIGFEDWALNYGYEPDSRKAESIYRTCLELALTLRNRLGEKLFGELRETVSGY